MVAEKWNKRVIRVRRLCSRCQLVVPSRYSRTRKMTLLQYSTSCFFGNHVFCYIVCRMYRWYVYVEKYFVVAVYGNEFFCPTQQFRYKPTSSQFNRTNGEEHPRCSKYDSLDMEISIRIIVCYSPKQVPMDHL